MVKYNKIKYKNNSYAVMNVKYKNIDYPVVVNWEDFKTINNFNKKWRSNKHGFIYCSHDYNDDTKDVFLHAIVMHLKQESLGKTPQQRSILHLNRIGLDNRRENLVYNIPGKKINKNIKKKKRTIKLPASTGIDPDEIPTYVWYMKPNGTHGERFMVKIGDVEFKTTASKKLSLRYKLEEAKMFLRQLKKDRADLFETNSMNGDYNKSGLNLMKSYYHIIKKAGYDHIKNYTPKNKTKNLIRSKCISGREKRLLQDQGDLLQCGGKKRRLTNNIPKNFDFTSNDLPKHCYYRPKYKDRSDYFVVENHPLQKKKYWQTTSSGKVSTNSKYKQLLIYLDNLNYNSDSDSLSDYSDNSANSY